MAAKIDNRSLENLEPRGAWRRRGAHPRARSSRPSNHFRFASIFPSCRTFCANPGQSGTVFPRCGQAPTDLRWRCLVKNRDEHWRDILQEIFRFGTLENGGVLPQFVSDLVNDELASLLKRFVRFSQQRALLIDLENAERDAGENVIARTETVAFQLVRQGGCIAMDHMDARIAGKLPLQRARERRVELKQEQMRIWCHPPRDLTRVHAFARTVFRNHAQLSEIHFARDAFHQRLRTWNNRRDLE